MDEPGTSRTQTLLAAAPNPANLAPDEEIEILTEDEARLSMTERAAEVIHSPSFFSSLLSKLYFGLETEQHSDVGERFECFHPRRSRIGRVSRISIQA